MTTLSQLENAISHLLRAKELAEFYHWPQSFVDRIDLLMRGTVNTRDQLRRESTENSLLEQTSEI